MQGTEEERLSPQLEHGNATWFHGFVLVVERPNGVWGVGPETKMGVRAQLTMSVPLASLGELQFPAMMHFLPITEGSSFF